VPPTAKRPGLIRPHAKIAILTRHNHPHLFARARRARLNGFVLKQDSFEELNYAIRTMLRGGFYMPPSMSGAMVEPSMESDPIECLTPRERSAFALYAQGYVVKDIASCLHVSVKTAETHLNNLRRKLGHPNRAQVTAFALSHHLVDAFPRVAPNLWVRPSLWLGPASGSYSLQEAACLTGKPSQE